MNGIIDCLTGTDAEAINAALQDNQYSYTKDSYVERRDDEDRPRIFVAGPGTQFFTAMEFVMAHMNAEISPKHFSFPPKI